MATRNNRKLALSVLGLGAATAAVVFGSWATWTAQTTNPGNTVTAGTLSLNNSRGVAQPVLTTSVSNIKPGATGSESATITNTGSVALASLRLSLSNAAGFTGDTENLLQFRIHDDTTDRCIFPADAAGACSTWGTWDNTANFANFTLKEGAGAGTVDPWSPDPDGAGAGTGEAHTFTIDWRFTNGASPDNDSQGDTATFDLTWDAVV